MPRVCVLFLGPSSASVLPFPVLETQTSFGSLHSSAKLLWLSSTTNYSVAFHGLVPPSTHSRVTHRPPSSNYNMLVGQPPIDHSSLKFLFCVVCDLDPEKFFHLRISVVAGQNPRL